jgi:hypothetical protein
MTRPPSIRIAITQAAGPVLVAWPEGDAWRELEVAPRGWWPSWSAGGALAISDVETGRGESVATLQVVHARDPALQPSTIARDSPAALIAPRTAHYVLWRDDGEELCYVAPSEGSLALFAAAPSGLEPPRRLLSGAPLFVSWEPGGARLAVHHGSELSIVDVTSGSMSPVSQHAAGFRTPVYRDDGGWLAFAEPATATTGVDVCIVGPDGSGRRLVAQVNGGVALAFRPGSRELTIGVTRSPDSGVFDELLMVDPASGGRRRIFKGPLVAYWWAPAGDRLAVVVPWQTGDGRHQVQIVAAGGTVLASAEPLVPSQDLRTVLAFFDQYGLSHRLWAPDGSGLVVAGRLVSDGIASSFSDPPGDCVYWWCGQRVAALERIRHGIGASFLPKVLAWAPNQVNGG